MSSGQINQIVQRVRDNKCFARADEKKGRCCFGAAKANKQAAEPTRGKMSCGTFINAMYQISQSDRGDASRRFK